MTNPTEKRGDVNGGPKASEQRPTKQLTIDTNGTNEGTCVFINGRKIHGVRVVEYRVRFTDAESALQETISGYLVFEEVEVESA